MPARRASPGPLVPQAVRAILACPKCGGRMIFKPGLCSCECGAAFTARNGVYSFARKDFTDKYDTEGMASRYARYAFGTQLPRTPGDPPPDGRAEGLYRAISDICRGELLTCGLSAPVIVDMACGVGRTVYDLAAVKPEATVIGFDLSATLAGYASKICAGRPVRCGADEDGWPVTNLRKPELTNVFIAQADACAPPLIREANLVTHASSTPNLVLVSMLLDRLRSPQEVCRTLTAAIGALAAGGLLVASTPFNWTTDTSWRHFGLSRTWLAAAIEERGLVVETYFDFLPYREGLDPFGTILELPVQVCTARKATMPVVDHGKRLACD